MNHTDKSTYLTYSLWNGTNRKTINLNPRELNNFEIQEAIDQFVYAQGELKKSNQRLEKLVDELLNENTNLKRVLDRYREVNSGY